VAQARRVNLLVKKNVKPTPAPRASEEYGIPPLASAPSSAWVILKNMPDALPGTLSGGSWPPKRGAKIKKKTQQIIDDFERCAQTGAPWRTHLMAKKHGVTSGYLQTLHDRWKKKKAGEESRLKRIALT
jgi:hypothetical protein